MMYHVTLIAIQTSDNRIIASTTVFANAKNKIACAVEWYKEQYPRCIVAYDYEKVEMFC